MKNVSKNTDGTYDVQNLSKKEIILLLSLVGRSCNTHHLTHADELFNKLLSVYPEFGQLYKTLGLSTIDAQSQEINSYYEMHSNSGLKWVAYFTYPDSKNRWRNVKRAVVTELNHPSELGEYDDITGIDKARNAYRRFKRDSVVGFVAWVQEKA